jgi:hypothetical protein
MSCHPNAGLNHDTRQLAVPSKLLKVSGNDYNNQNYIHEEIKLRFVSENGCYNSIHNFLFSHYLSKNMKIKKCKAIILYVELYACETWSLKLGEEHMLRLLKTGS